MLFKIVIGDKKTTIAIAQGAGTYWNDSDLRSSGIVTVLQPGLPHGFFLDRNLEQVRTILSHDFFAQKIVLSASVFSDDFKYFKIFLKTSSFFYDVYDIFMREKICYKC